MQIKKAEDSKDSKEFSFLLYISRSTLDYPGKKHVIELLDHFEHIDSNGNHLCIVLLMVSDAEVGDFF